MAKNAISDYIAAISSFICVLVFGAYLGKYAPNFFLPIWALGVDIIGDSL